ncbi:MAG: hypothetical protein M3310_05860 [Actinomycetota bacterium]|nr:hypothetical protein [Actinomycetota bacterium]
MSDPMERELESRETATTNFEDRREDEQIEREDAAERLQDEQQPDQNEP